MSVDKSTVVRIAQLAKIKVPEEDLKTLAEELSRIIEWVEQLNEVNTDDIEPMASTVGPTALCQREDVVADGGYAEEVLLNAPETKNGYFIVPKVIE